MMPEMPMIISPLESFLRSNASSAVIVPCGQGHTRAKPTTNQGGLQEPSGVGAAMPLG
jgi:hypothetical protein